MFPAIIFAVGVLLLIGLIPLGPLGRIIGILVCIVCGAIFWGLGGALLVGGLTTIFFSASLGSGIDAPIITHSPIFQIITGPVAIVVAIIGIIVLIFG